MKLEAMYTTTLSRKVVVQRVVRFASRFEGKMDMQPDFPINSPNRLYAEVEKVPTYLRGLLRPDHCPHHCSCVPSGPAACVDPLADRVRGHQTHSEAVLKCKTNFA